VSRAYSAAFHLARTLLRRCGFQPPEQDQAHAYLWRRLANSGHPEIQAAGNQLNELRRFRNWADYDLDHALNHPTTCGHLYLGEGVCQLLETVAAEPTVCAVITEAIKVYERDVLRQVTWQA
jgi:hypothetical protein